MHLEFVDSQAPEMYSLLHMHAHMQPPMHAYIIPLLPLHTHT